MSVLDDKEVEALKYYADLTTLLETDMRMLGFDATRQPPGEEPTLKKGADSLSLPDLKAAYDEYLAYYDFLTTQRIRFATKLLVCQARLDHAQAMATLQVARNKEVYSNAELRDAAVRVEPAVVSASTEVLYLRGMRDSLEERRHSMTKTMDRLYREIMLRTDRGGGGPQHGKQLEGFQPPWARQQADTPRFSKRPE